jgi:PAS domain S-box-containing protein
VPARTEPQLWRPFGLVALGATALFLVLPRGGLAQGILFVAFQAGALAALAYRVVRYRPTDRLTWSVLVVAQVVYLAATTVWYLYPVGWGRALPYPSVIDVLFWCAYLSWAFFLARLIWRQGVGDPAASLDALVVAGGLGIMAWEFLLEPALDAPDVATSARVSSLVYTATLLVVAVVAVRLAMVARVRTFAHVLIGAWVLLELVADVWYTLAQANGVFEYGSPWFAAWLLSYGAVAALALHPDMAALTQPSRARPGGGVGRLAALAVAVGGALLTIAVKAGDPGDVAETRALLGVTGAIVAIVVFRLGLDIAQRRRAEDDANRRAGTLEAVFAASPDPIIVTDRDGTVSTISEAAGRVLGIPGDQWRGRTILDLVHPDDRERVADAVQEVVAGSTVAVTVRHRLHAPGEVVVDSHVTLMRERDHLRGAVIVCRDVSAQVETERQLRLAKDEAEAANRAKTEFLSRMSHELRTPLNAILGFAQLTAYDDLTDDQRVSIDQILRAGRHLLGLIDDVLDIARVESGAFSMSSEPVAVVDVARRAAGLLAPMAAQHGIALDIPGGDEVYVRADAQRLVQVLVNLVSNGIKYNREHGTVAVRWSRGDDATVRVEVSDTGRGIPDAVRSRLFTPFDRLGAEATGVEGTGVGLALAKRLVEAMGGSVEVNSLPGTGTTFVVTLSEARGPRHGAADLAVPERPASLLTDGAPATVLYVEDNLANFHLVERIFRSRPHISLLAAMQGRIALDMARHARPRLILLDQYLPDMTGAEVLDILRSDPQTATIPVVVVSADVRPASIRQSQDAGATAYVAKPLDIREFLAVVDDILDRDSAA